MRKRLWANSPCGPTNPGLPFYYSAAEEEVQISGDLELALRIAQAVSILDTKRNAILILTTNLNVIIFTNVSPHFKIFQNERMHTVSHGYEG